MAGPSSGGASSTAPSPVVQSNFAATVPPTATDDANAGYSVGSLWIIPTTGDMFRCRSATAGAARWAKIDVADHPGHVAGLFYTPFGQGAPVNGTSGFQNVLYLALGVIKQRITITQLQARLQTASSGGLFQLAVYNHNPVTAKPSTLLASTASLSEGTAGLINSALVNGDTPFEPGFYWFGGMHDNTTGVLLTVGHTSQNEMSLVGSATGLSNDGTRMPSGYSYSGLTVGSLPADLSSLTPTEVNIRVPLVAFKVGSVP